MFVLAGADQTIVDENGQTAYEVAVAQGNEEISNLLKPVLDSDGRNISGLPYATNNPRHPNFRPEARRALFALFALNETMALRQGGDDVDADDEYEDVEDDDENGENNEDEGNNANGGQ